MEHRAYESTNEETRKAQNIKKKLLGDRPRTSIICGGYIIRNNIMDNVQLTSANNQPVSLTTQPTPFNHDAPPRMIETSWKMPYTQMPINAYGDGVNQSTLPQMQQTDFGYQGGCRPSLWSQRWSSWCS